MELAKLGWRPIVGLFVLRLSLNRGSWRFNVAYIIGIPLFFFLWGRGQAANQLDPTRLLIGTLVLSALVSVLRQVGKAVTMDLGGPGWELLSTTELTPNRYLAAQLLDGLSLASLPIILLALVVILGFPNAPTALGWLVPYFLGVVSFTAIGVGLAAAPRTPSPFGNPWSTVTAVSLAAFCPLLYPIDRVPEVILPIVEVLPPTLVSTAMLASWTGEGMAESQLAALGGWCFVLIGWAYHGVRRSFESNL
jgi:hypothetical protein